MLVVLVVPVELVVLVVLVGGPVALVVLVALVELVVPVVLVGGPVVGAGDVGADVEGAVSPVAQAAARNDPTIVTATTRPTLINDTVPTGRQPDTTIRARPTLAAMTTTESGVRTIDGIELTPKQVGLELPAPFATVEEERLHRKQKLAGALRVFGRVGFGEGVAGHITVRDPEFPELFWVNPFAVSFRHIRVSDLILVDHDGNVVYGTRPVNRAAFVIHSAVHEARPDVIAAAHSHSVHGKAFSSLGIPLDPITQDSCIFYEDHVVVTAQRGRVQFGVEDGRELVSQFPQGKAAIHQNHGLFTVGSSVDEAAFWFLSMDRSCQAQLLAMAAGTPQLIPHDDAVYTREQTASPIAGWLSFQPLWQEICRTDPDLFE